MTEIFQWTLDNPPDEVRSKPVACIKAAVEAGNLALLKGRTKEEALFSCLFASGTVERKLHQQQQAINKARVVPQHLQAVLDLRNSPKETSEQPTAASKHLGNTNVAYLRKNQLQPDSERSLISAEFDKQGRLVLLFDTNEKITTNPQMLNEYIEQHIAIATGIGGTIRLNTRTTAIDTEVTLTDHTIRCEPVADLVVTMPSANLCEGQSFSIKKTNSSIYKVSIMVVGGDVIDGSLVAVITEPYLSLHLQSYGTGYDIV